MDEIEAGDTDGLDDEDPERVGGTFPHTFILEVIQDAENESEQIDIVKDQPWDPSSSVERRTLDVSVSPALHGIQLPEEAFRLPA